MLENSNKSFNTKIMSIKIIFPFNEQVSKADQFPPPPQSSQPFPTHSDMPPYAASALPNPSPPL